MRGLKNMSGKKGLFIFKVNGISKFPMNLLSSEKCFPSDKEDVFNITENNFGKRSVNLVSHHPPSVAPWRAEGWTLVFSMLSQDCRPDNEYDEYHTWPC